MSVDPSTDPGETDELWNIKFRVDEEQEFFTELALHETQRWIESVTRKTFKYPDDPRKSLENGILLCELLNALKPACIRRINKLPTPLAGLDNINVFLQACKSKFNLSQVYLFDPCNLEDLSQRAIAETDYLKQEVDKRLRNVAITIYWLARSVASTYDGPELDYSAFSALVTRHGKELISDEHIRSHNSWESNSSAYGSADSANRSSILNDSVDIKHQRDGSYDSLGSYGRTSEDSQSFDEHSVENMPVKSDMSRYGSNTSRGRLGSDGRSSSFDKTDSVFRNNPDSARGSHARTSSGDSGDDSLRGSHSRHSSTSSETYPTRRLSDQRQASVSADPLQFIKAKSSSRLAEQAAQQMRMLSDSKKKQVEIVEPVETKKTSSSSYSSFSPPSAETSDDWQSNLSSWKNRRKSASANIYQLKEDKEKEKEEETQPTEQPEIRTYSQIMEERDRRKSTGRMGLKTYPRDDDEDDDAVGSYSYKSRTSTPAQKDAKIVPDSNDSFSPVNARSSERSWTSSTKPESKKASEQVPPWAKDSTDDEEGSSEESTADEEDDAKISPKHIHDKIDITPSKLSNGDRLSSDSGLNGDTSTPHTRDSSMDSGVDSISHIESKSKVIDISVDEPVHTDVNGNNNVMTGDVSMVTKDDSAKDVIQETPVRPARRTGLSCLKSEPNSFMDTVPSGKCIEKTIKISRNKKGFGFTISGGSDENQPIVVSRVSLGSPADVCELEKKDEVIAINGTSLQHMSSAEVKKMIEDCEVSGSIELKVKRQMLDNEEDEDFSDDDAPPPQPMSRPPEVAQLDTPKISSDSPSSSQNYPMLRSLQNEMSKEQDWIKNEITHKTEDRSQANNKSFSSTESAPLSPDYTTDITHSKIFETPVSQVESTPSHNVPLRRQQTPNSSLQPTRLGNGDALRDMISPTPSSQSDESFGLPDILRKWQSRKPDMMKNKRMSCTLPMPYERRIVYEPPPTKDDISVGKVQRENSSERKTDLSSLKFDKETERQRIEQWAEQQEKDRQNGHGLHDRIDSNSSQEQEKFEQDSVVMRHKYEEDLEKAEQKSKENEEKEKEMIGSEMDKIKKLEEKRKERMEKYRQQQKELNIAPENQIGSSPSLSEQLSPVRVNLTAQSAPQAHREPEKSSRSPRSPRSPRQEYTTPSPKEEETIKSLLTKEEKERILVEEREKIRKEERKKLEEERQKHEYEEHQRLMDKEAELRMKEEKIKREEERLKLEKSKLERQKELELEKANRPRPGNVSAYRGRIDSPPDESAKSPKKFDTRRFSVDSSLRSPPLSHLSNNRFFQSSDSTPKQFRPMNISGQSGGTSIIGRPHYSSSVTVEPEKSQQFVVEKASTSSGQPLDVDNDSAKSAGGAFLSRDDVVAMNRKATPATPPTAVKQPEKKHSVGSGIIREKPTRKEIISLNAVPRRKCFGSNWNSGESLGTDAPIKEASQKTSPRLRRSEIMKQAMSGSQDHWLVEEAERRRLAEQDSAQRYKHRHSVHSFSYSSPPIKAVDDEHANRWRDDSTVSSSHSEGGKTMPEQIRKTLLQKTSAQRVSPTPGYGQPSAQRVSPTPGYVQPESESHFHSLSQTMPTMSSLPASDHMPVPAPRRPITKQEGPPAIPASKPSRSALSVDTASDQISKKSVSGNQICSSCGEELGFGAAMVIESLNLQYHVQCFRCCVCHSQLTNGDNGADVRVRVNKIHCRNCYSNDEAGLKFSKV